MTHQSKPGTIQFALDLPLEPKLRFETLHESLGFKTKVQTFQAILYFVSTKDKIDPATLQRVEKKIDHSIQLLESDLKITLPYRPQLQRHDSRGSQCVL